MGTSPLRWFLCGRRVRDAAPYEMGRGRHIWRPYTALLAYLSVGPRYIAAAHTCAEVWRRCGAPPRSPAQHPQGVRRIRKAAKRTIWSLRRRCHAAGWAHGRVAKSGLREKCRSGLCPSPVFSSAPCLSSPMRLPSALLAVTLRLFATPGFPPAPGTNSQFANWPGLYPSPRSIRAAHDGFALLFRQFPQKFFRNLLKRAKRTGIIERQCM